MIVKKKKKNKKKKKPQSTQPLALETTVNTFFFQGPLPYGVRRYGGMIIVLLFRIFGYSRIPISRTFEENENWFEKSGVREIKGGIK